MQKTIEITAQPRVSGKGHSKAYRANRTIPAVAYGPDMKENVNFTIPQNDAVKYTGSKAYDNALFKINSEDKNLNKLSVIIKSVAKSPTTHLPLHIDFYAPDMKKTIRVNVEIKFIGKPEGVKDGGVFNVIRREVEIECLPTEIPEAFEVNVESMGLNSALHISDLNLDPKYKVFTEEKITVANITVVEEEAEVPVAAATEETPAAEGDAPAEGVAPAEGAAADTDKK